MSLLISMNGEFLQQYTLFPRLGDILFPTGK